MMMRLLKCIDINMKESCVIAYGMVGQAAAKLFGVEKHFDINPERSNMTLEEASKCKIVFICMPTPENEGNYMVDNIKSIISQIKEYGGSQVFVMRSTVFPGFADHLKKELGVMVISNPEFLTESTWEKDTKNPDFVLLGGDASPELDLIKGIYEARLKATSIILTDNTTAELAKLSLNGFFTTKVVYANLIFDLCQRLKANYGVVKEVLEKHKFGYKNHAEISHNGGRGAGGKCLRKDMKVLASLSNTSVLKEIMNQNESYLKEFPKQ